MGSKCPCLLGTTRPMLKTSTQPVPSPSNLRDSRPLLLATRGNALHSQQSPNQSQNLSQQPSHSQSYSKQQGHSQNYSQQHSHSQNYRHQQSHSHGIQMDVQGPSKGQPIATSPLTTWQKQLLASWSLICNPGTVSFANLKSLRVLCQEQRFTNWRQIGNLSKTTFEAITSPYKAWQKQLGVAKRQN